MIRIIASCICALGVSFGAVNYDPLANWLQDYETKFEWVAQSTIDLIEHFEGKSYKAYQDSQGNWTIGIGHYIKSQEAYLMDRRLSEDEVRGILYRDLEKCSTALKTNLNTTVTREQADALMSLCHNIGPDNMVKSEVIRHLNRGDIKKAGNAFLNWNKPADLINRRRIEKALFLGA